MKDVTTVQVRSAVIERDSAKSSAIRLYDIDSVTVITIERGDKEGGHGFPQIQEKKLFYILIIYHCRSLLLQQSYHAYYRTLNRTLLLYQTFCKTFIVHYVVFRKRSLRSLGFFMYSSNLAKTFGDSDGVFDNTAVLEVELGVWLSHECEHDEYESKTSSTSLE